MKQVLIFDLGTTILTTTDTIVIISGGIIALIFTLSMIFLLVRCHRRVTRQQRRRAQIRTGESDSYLDLIGSDQHQLLGEERVSAGMPPTYDEAMEEPPVYKLQEGNDREASSVNAPEGSDHENGESDRTNDHGE